MVKKSQVKTPIIKPIKKRTLVGELLIDIYSIQDPQDPEGWVGVKLSFYPFLSPIKLFLLLYQFNTVVEFVDAIEEQLDYFSLLKYDDKR
jgi:hypothetical protein